MIRGMHVKLLQEELLESQLLIPKDGNLYLFFMDKRFDWVLKATDNTIYLVRRMRDLYFSNFENMPES